MLYPVILCGGNGTRLWPLSRDMYPKQFVYLGDGRTLLKDTVKRALGLPDTGAMFIVCNETHRFYVSGELLECGTQGSILLESVPRNTAPGIALAAFAAQAQGDDPLLLVLPSGHMLQNTDVFAEGVKKASIFARKGHIVTFGITPDGPKTGFGYIQQGESQGDKGFRVARFVEKTDAATASAMLEEGGYSWNSGIFLFSASVYLRELQTYAPEIFGQCRKAWEGRREDGAFVCLQAAAFTASPSDFIDYVVMAHTGLAAVCPLNDLVSWEAFYQIGKKDGDGNVCTGDVVQENPVTVTSTGRTGLWLRWMFRSSPLLKRRIPFWSHRARPCRESNTSSSSSRLKVGRNIGCIRWCTGHGEAMNRWPSVSGEKDHGQPRRAAFAPDAPSSCRTLGCCERYGGDYQR